MHFIDPTPLQELQAIIDEELYKRPCDSICKFIHKNNDTKIIKKSTSITIILQ